MVAHTPAMDLCKDKTKIRKAKIQTSESKSGNGDAGFATHHSIYIISDAIDGSTLRGVAIAEAVATHNQLIDSIIILFFNFWSGVK